MTILTLLLFVGLGILVLSWLYCKFVYLSYPWKELLVAFTFALLGFSYWRLWQTPLPWWIWLVSILWLIAGLGWQIKKLQIFWIMGTLQTESFLSLASRLMIPVLKYGWIGLGVIFFPTLILFGIYQTLFNQVFSFSQIGLIVLFIFITICVFNFLSNPTNSAPGLGMIIFLPPLIGIILAALLSFAVGLTALPKFFSTQFGQFYQWILIAIASPMGVHILLAIASAFILPKIQPKSKFIVYKNR